MSPKAVKYCSLVKHGYYAIFMFSCVSLALCGPDTSSYNGFVPCTSCSDDQYQLYYGATTCLPCTEHTSSKIGKCKKDKQQSSSLDQSKENLQHLLIMFTFHYV